MLSLRTRLMTLALVILIFSGVIGSAFSERAGWITAVVCLALVLVHQLWHTSKLTELLLSPSYGEVPGALGIWGEIYYRLHKLVKGWHDQVLEVGQQHQRFIQAIQASPSGVVMLNEDDQVEWCNACLLYTSPSPRD